ncbi:uncharacterized protein K452DRAFT_245730 [Aplosporella prunicola CBS 121167]|uniref:Methyltransferase small domain-containing protein n=1 Tax=Aplosporella prunicola CBS 121167 TaxID=1176127 RepID=A0A6A6BKX3_9PEZI|nr:uncharacterized protein K452DRAFT_245730 [Aplosporella prunicola CBS 121167]KAF2144686.1 hypothetical protein K452DRAFT_245730 [Aplosporella prunicola CBS 121167]
MLPTPNTAHVDFDRVYEPAEDSFLLLDTLSAAGETAFLHDRFGAAASPLVAEVGPGSGVVLAFVAQNARTIFGRSDVLTLGLDISAFACHATDKTVRSAIKEAAAPHSIYLDALNADLSAPLRPGAVDVLIFNPPYVPAEMPDLAQHERYNQYASGTQKTTFEQDSYLLSLTYAGGVDGMETTNRLLEELPHILQAERGVAYILLCAQNKPREVEQRVKAWGPEWSAASVGSSGKQAGWEKLQILRIWRNP